MNITETTHSNELGALFEALSKAQGRIENALKDKNNPFFKSRYADLASVWDACREPLSSNGLSVIQTVEGTKDEMFLNTWIGHSSGQWMKSKLPLIIIPEAKKDKSGNVTGYQLTPQGIGSAITYGRRYSLSALVGICADEDDDGEKAMARNNPREPVNTNNNNTKEKEDLIRDERFLSEFHKSYQNEEYQMIKAYTEKYANHWKKTITQSLQDFTENSEKFESDFNKWKAKQPKTEIRNVA